MSIRVTDEVIKDVVSILYDGYTSNKYFSDAELYKSYKNGELPENLGGYELDIRVLSLLESLGFSMHQAGTYLFKELIIKIILILSHGGKDTRRQLEESLNEPYSAFYFDLAQNDLDLGIKSFFGFINEALSAIDYNAADPDILAFFESTLAEGNIGALALRASDYVKVGVQKAALGL